MHITSTALYDCTVQVLRKYFDSSHELYELCNVYVLTTVDLGSGWGLSLERTYVTKNERKEKTAAKCVSSQADEDLY